MSVQFPAIEVLCLMVMDGKGIMCYVTKNKTGREGKVLSIKPGRAKLGSSQTEEGGIAVIINKARIEVRMDLALYDGVRWAAYRRHMSVNKYVCSVLQLAVQADYAEAAAHADEEAAAIKARAAAQGAPTAPAAPEV